MSLQEQIMQLYPKLYLQALGKARHREDAEDIIQSVIMKFLERPDEIKQVVKERGITLEIYLKRVVNTTFIDLWRKKKREPTGHEDFISGLEDMLAKDATSSGLLFRDIAKHLVATGEKCLKLLTKRAEGAKQAELAVSLGITQSAVNKRIARCLKDFHLASGGVYHEK